MPKIPPQAIASEKVILASLLVCQGLIDDVIEDIEASMFYYPANKKIMAAIEALYSQSKHIDLVSVSEELKKASRWSAVDLTAYLAELMEEVSTSRGISTHIAIVKNKYDLRRIIEISQLSIQGGHENDANSEDILSTAEGKLLEIYQKNEKVKACHVSYTIGETLEGIQEAMSRGGTPKITTGFTALDEITGGLHGGEMVVVASRPGMGKTSLGLNILANCKQPSAFFSIEMPKTQLTQRLFSRYSNVPLYKIRNGKLSRDEIERIQKSTEIITSLPLYIDDSYRLTIPILRSKLRRLLRKYEIKVAAIDYLQIMTSDSKGKSTTESTTELSHGIMGLAKELNIAIIVLAQLSRGPENRPLDQRRPTPSDLRDSGAIENDAHLIVFPYRNYFYTKNEDEKNNAELIIAKQRNGPSGVHVDVYFDGETTNFRDKNKEDEIF